MPASCLALCLRQVEPIDEDAFPQDGLGHRLSIWQKTAPHNWNIEYETRRGARRSKSTVTTTPTWPDSLFRPIHAAQECACDLRPRDNHCRDVFTGLRFGYPLCSPQTTSGYPSLASSQKIPHLVRVAFFRIRCLLGLPFGSIRDLLSAALTFPRRHRARLRSRSTPPRTLFRLVGHQFFKLFL